MTHDLLRIIVDVLGATVDKIEITGIHEDTYFARIVLRRDEEIFYVDARPSDSLALALRSDAPIYIEAGLFNKYKRNLQMGKEESDDIKERLKELDPGDFGNLDF